MEVDKWECRVCKIVKPIKQFGKNKRNGIKHAHICKSCKQDYDIKTYDRNKRAKWNKKNYIKNHKKILKKNLEYQYKIRTTKEGHIKYLAYQKFHYYKRVGKIISQPCEICGKKAQAHHEDYKKPLDIKWLCIQHHFLCHPKRAVI